MSDTTEPFFTINNVNEAYTDNDSIHKVEVKTVHWCHFIKTSNIYNTSIEILLNNEFGDGIVKVISSSFSISHSQCRISNSAKFSFLFFIFSL